MKSVLVTDIGGTKTRVARLAADLRVVAVRERPTARERERYLAELVGDLSELRDTRIPGVEPPTAIGAGTAGVVSADQRLIHYAPNLPLGADFPLAATLEEAVGLRATLINDGRASAVGEYRFGDAAGKDPLLALFFGTGIGIGLVVGGEPYGGAANAAGEVGHTIHIVGGRRCPCGRSGCYEAYCGGRPISERAATEIGPPPAGESKWNVGLVVAAAARDPRARVIVDDALRAAGALVAGLCTLLNPAAVVLGGGVVKGWPALAKHIEAVTREWCSAPVERSVVFVRSRGGSDAILWGAAAATGEI